MRQERFFGRTRTIRFRVHPHPDFHRARPAFFVTPALSRVEGSLLGKDRNTRVNADCPSRQDASVRPRRLFHRHYVGFEEKDKMPSHREGAKNAKQIKKTKSQILV
jgi:hypothetical protein